MKKTVLLRIREVQKYLFSLILFPFLVGAAGQDLQKKKGGKGKKKSPHLLSQNMTDLQCFNSNPFSV